MAGTLLGIDFGQSKLKIVQVSGSQIKKYAITDMPNHLFCNGHFVSIESAGELLKNLMKENGIRCNQGAVVLRSSQIFVRDIRMPLMTQEQLLFNLPFEFKDYITEEIKNYAFDYAVLSQTDEDLHLMAVAAPKAMIEEYRGVLRKAGVKMVMAAPLESCIPAVVAPDESHENTEYCMIDFGAESIRMYMYKGRCLTGNRSLEYSMSDMEDILAEEYHIDGHLAHTYFLNNYKDCQHEDKLLNVYRNISIELMRAMNFYRFRNPESNLKELWVCGGGASILPLKEILENEMEMDICDYNHVIQKADDISEINTLLGAFAVTQQ